MSEYGVKVGCYKFTNEENDNGRIVHIKSLTKQFVEVDVYNYYDNKYSMPHITSYEHDIHGHTLNDGGKIDHMCFKKKKVKGDNAGVSLFINTYNHYHLHDDYYIGDNTYGEWIKQQSEGVEEEEETEFCNYGEENGIIQVAGGGMMNGNAYATVELIGNKYWYCEYGKYASRECRGNKLEYNEPGLGFNIVDTEGVEEEQPPSPDDGTAEYDIDEQLAKEKKETEVVKIFATEVKEAINDSIMKDPEVCKLIAKQHILEIIVNEIFGKDKERVDSKYYVEITDAIHKL